MNKLRRLRINRFWCGQDLPAFSAIWVLRMASIKDLQKKIGYSFKNEKGLIHALTHSSYANEHHMKNHSDNERLEFLGDAVLEMISSEFLYGKYPEKPEGALTKLRASLVCEQALAAAAVEIALGEQLILGKGEDQTGGRTRKSVLSDAFEAVIGAIYLDGGFASAKEFIYRFVLSDIDNKRFFYDSKTILQEYVQGNTNVKHSYKLVSEDGPDHNKHFEVAVFIGDKEMGRGDGSTKKAAEQAAAYSALMRLKEMGVLNVS